MRHLHRIRQCTRFWRGELREENIGPGFQNSCRLLDLFRQYLFDQLVQHRAPDRAAHHRHNTRGVSVDALIDPGYLDQTIGVAVAWPNPPDRRDASATAACSTTNTSSL